LGGKEGAREAYRGIKMTLHEKEEVMEEKNELAIIVKESGLEPAKAQVMLDNFSDYFKVAAEWEVRAKTIIVKDASQIVDMKMARTGRLFLREKRIAIENTRKELKEQALREGKAIDGIANVLKALIVPIEEYLEQQERFVEIKTAAEAEARRIEAEKKAEEERIAKEKAEAEERERIRLENIRLQKEAEEREKAITAERAKVEAERQRKEKELAEERRKAEEERMKVERERQAEREKQARILAEQKEKAETARAKIEVERQRREEEIAEERGRVEAERRAEREKQESILAEERIKVEAEIAAAKAKLKAMITCPKCGHKFSSGDSQ